MNALHFSAADSPQTFASSLLYTAEFIGLQLDQATLRKVAKNAGDRWYYSAGEEVIGPVPLCDVFKALLSGVPSVAVLHESLTQDPAAVWTTVSYRALWLHPTIGTVWTVAFWFLTALVGWAIGSLILPLGIQQLFSLLYWLGALVAVPLLSIPPQMRERLKDCFRRRHHLCDGGRRKL